MFFDLFFVFIADHCCLLFLCGDIFHLFSDPTFDLLCLFMFSTLFDFKVFYCFCVDPRKISLWELKRIQIKKKKINNKK